MNEDIRATKTLIDAFCARTGWSVSNFSRKVFNDARWYDRMLTGHVVVRSLAKAREFIAKNERNS